MTKGLLYWPARLLGDANAIKKGKVSGEAEMSSYTLAGIIYLIGVIVAVLVVLLAKIIKKKRASKYQKGGDCNNDKRYKGPVILVCENSHNTCGYHP